VLKKKKCRFFKLENARKQFLSIYTGQHRRFLSVMMGVVDMFNMAGR